MCVSGSKKCLFLWKFSMLCVLVTSVLRYTFLPYYRWTHTSRRHVFKRIPGFQTFQQGFHPLFDFSIAKGDWKRSFKFALKRKSLLSFQNTPNIEILSNIRSLEHHGGSGVTQTWEIDIQVIPYNLCYEFYHYRQNT